MSERGVDERGERQLARVEPVALQPLAERGGDPPARRRIGCTRGGQLAIVVSDVIVGAITQHPPEHVAGGRGVVVPAVRGIAGHRGVGLRVDPVALQALAVRRAHDPARVLEPAVVVCEVDVAGRGICPPAAYHKALGAGVCPPAGLGRVEEFGGSRLAVHHPVALQAVAVVAILNGPSRVSRLRGGGGLRNGGDTVCRRCLCRRCLALLLRGDLDIHRCIYALFICLLLSSRICRGARARRRTGVHVNGRTLRLPCDRHRRQLVCCRCAALRSVGVHQG